MKITLKQMSIFNAIVESDGNMTTAAQKVFLTQSACSMALSCFETQLGNLVFERRGKKLIVNEIGRLVYEYTRKIVNSSESLEQVAQQSNHGQLMGKLHIIASSTVGNYILPQKIINFTMQHPNVKIKLDVSNTIKTIDQILQGEYDLGFIEGNCDDGSIMVKPWANDELVIVAGKNHPLSTKKFIQKSELLEAQWILRETGSGTREKLETALKQKLTPFLELGNTEAIKHALYSGVGISCLSKATVQNSIEQGQLIALSIPSLNLKRTFDVIYCDDKYMSPTLKAFLLETRSL